MAGETRPDWTTEGDLAIPINPSAEGEDDPAGWRWLKWWAEEDGGTGEASAEPTTGPPPTGNP